MIELFSVIGPQHGSIIKGVWRNGSASDPGSEGWYGATPARLTPDQKDGSSNLLARMCHMKWGPPTTLTSFWVVVLVSKTACSTCMSLVSMWRAEKSQFHLASTQDRNLSNKLLRRGGAPYPLGRTGL